MGVEVLVGDGVGVTVSVGVGVTVGVGVGVGVGVTVSVAPNEYPRSLHSGAVIVHTAAPVIASASEGDATM